MKNSSNFLLGLFMLLFASLPAQNVNDVFFNTFYSPTAVQVDMQIKDQLADTIIVERLGTAYQSASSPYTLPGDSLLKYFFFDGESNTSIAFFQNLSRAAGKHYFSHLFGISSYHGFFALDLPFVTEG